MSAPVRTDRRGLMLGYWGRHGAMARLAHQAAGVAIANDAWRTAISVSRQSDNFGSYAGFGDALVPVDTFSSRMGALTQAWRISALRRRLCEEIRARRIDVFLELIPHVWSPFVSSAIRGAGARYVTIAHDAVAHPGDATALVKPFLDRALRQADRVIVLSGAVETALVRAGHLPASRIRRAFLPDVIYGPPSPHGYEPGRPLRLLFLGRIMAYKGLGLFVEAGERLHAAGIPVELGVFGEGSIQAEAERLRRLGASVENRWLSDEELGCVLARYDLVVVSHVEASQSAVVATAFGAGMPVVVTPVGGLHEQVEHGVDGVVASAATGPALAEAIAEVACRPELYGTMRDAIQARRATRSMEHFLDVCMEAATSDA